MISKHYQLLSLGILLYSASSGVSIAQETTCDSYMLDEAGNQVCLDSYFTPPTPKPEVQPVTPVSPSPNVTIREIEPEVNNQYRQIVTVEGEGTGKFVTENNEIVTKKGKLESLISNDGIIMTPQGKIQGFIQPEESYQIILNLRGEITGIIPNHNE